MAVKSSLTPRTIDWGQLTAAQWQVRDRVLANFFTGFDKNWFLAPLQTSAQALSTDYRFIGEAYVKNLAALIAVVALPITFASNRASDLRFQQLLMAERIRRIPITTGGQQSKADNQLTSQDEEEALKIARRRMAEEIESPNNLRDLAWRAYEYLSAGLTDEEFNSASSELLRQGAVLAWGAIEVLARDLFAAYVNSHPEYAAHLAAHPSTKARFNLKAIDLSELAAHRFDLSKSMGTFLLQATDFSELAVIKDTYSVLFPPDNSLRSALSEATLWMLYQRRHLIVHKRGVVDRQYCDKTGEALKIGSQLFVSPEDIGKYVTISRDLGQAFFSAVGSTTSAST